MNTPLAVAVVLVFFLVVDGLLLYRYQLLLQEVQRSGSLITAPELEPTAEAATTPSTPTSMQNQKALRVGVKVEDAPSWLRVIADGRSVLSQESRPGFSQTFEADKEIVVQAWNAGAVSVEANGKDVGRLGKSGEHWDWTFAL